MAADDVSKRQMADGWLEEAEKERDRATLSGLGVGLFAGAAFVTAMPAAVIVLVPLGILAVIASAAKDIKQVWAYARGKK